MPQKDYSQRGIWRKTYIPHPQESQFMQWYADHAASTGLAPSPDDPLHKYDYRAAYLAGASPEPNEDGSYHWPSQFKSMDHPDRFIRLNSGGILDSLLDRQVQ